MKISIIDMGALRDEASRATLTGAVLPRSLSVGGERWSKGRTLSGADLERLAAEPALFEAGPIAVLIAEVGDVHEDEAGTRLAMAVAGPGIVLRGPAESRVDLLAAVDGVVRIRVSALERLDRIDPLEVFTVFDGQIVRAGDLVASVKVAPQLVEERALARGEAIARRGGPIVRVEAFGARKVGVLVKESVHGPARERFETSVRTKVEGLGSSVAAIVYVADDPAAVVAGFRTLRGAGARLILTAGARSMDPSDACFVALAELGGVMVRRGVPAHPGSMLWLARIGRVPVIGLPTCGAYSKATAADLLLPRLLAGEPASRATVARLGHGGILTRSMRFRFPAYARELDAPDG